MTFSTVERPSDTSDRQLDIRDVEKEDGKCIEKGLEIEVVTLSRINSSLNFLVTEKKEKYALERCFGNMSNQVRSIMIWNISI